MDFESFLVRKIFFFPSLKLKISHEVVVEIVACEKLFLKQMVWKVQTVEQKFIFNLF